MDQEGVPSEFAGGPRDRIAIAKVMRHPEAVRTYLEETFAITGDAAHVAEVGERFAELAQIAMSFSEEERADLLAALAESLWILDPSLRHDLLADKILPEARTSDALSAVVRQMDVDEVCRMFVDGLSGGEVSKEGLARAVRNLALISTADREDVINAAGLAMSRAGFDQALVSEIQTMAAPSTLTVRSLPGGGREPAGSVETIFRLLDLAPGQEARLEPDDHSLAMLKDEARAGISDGDVISALVSLATMDIREAQFASTMSMIEDSLGLLVARGEIDVAADAAYALLAASERPELSHAQRTRLAHAIERFARPADVRMLADALRLFQPGEPEYEGARRLLDSLGALALQPLLEALADEPDMAARKALVDLLSQRASQHISELGEYVTDPRWYFVRNVVSILGATRSSATIMYLERTLRHADPRVRRETIRALANIADRIATQMLIAGLADDEAQNVQLAARYLGARHDLAAASALETVAKGEGRGNRENGPRVEAIEALGRLGATQSMRTLESLAGNRAFLGAARARELRTAAESAIAAIRAKGGAQ